MLLETISLLVLIGKTFGDGCSKYAAKYNYAYYSYCTGYCSGSYGNQYCNTIAATTSASYSYSSYHYYLTNNNDISNEDEVLPTSALIGVLIGSFFGLSVFITAVILCIRSHNRRKVGTVNRPQNNGTRTVVPRISGYIQTRNLQGQYPQLNQYNMHPSPTGYAAYPPPPMQGYTAPTQTSHTPMYNQPFSYAPQSHI